MCKGHLVQSLRVASVAPLWFCPKFRRTATCHEKCTLPISLAASCKEQHRAIPSIAQWVQILEDLKQFGEFHHFQCQLSRCRVPWHPRGPQPRQSYQCGYPAKQCQARRWLQLLVWQAAASASTFTTAAVAAAIVFAFWAVDLLFLHFRQQN